MGLLDDFFRKDEINELKKQLIEKTNEVTRLESLLSTLSNRQLAFEQRVAQLNKVVADGSVSHNALTIALARSQAEIARQATELESFKRTASDQKSETSTTIAELQKTAAAFAPEIAAAKSERDAKANELQRLRAIYDEKDREYLGREAKLSEKSEKLLQERQKFQQQAMDLQIREQHWKHVIEPQISKYESHVSLDLRKKQVEDREAQLEQLERALSEREADMVRRQCLDETLKSREAEISEWNQLLLDRATELEAQTYKLDALSLELAAFRERAAQLDDEAARIEAQAEKIQAKEDEQQAKHVERLTELRQQRAELRKTGKELNLRELDLKETGKKLNLRELDLKEREKTVNGEEALIQTMKNKNFQLRKEEKRLNALLEECEGEKQEETRSKVLLHEENATLRSRISELVQSTGKRKAVKESDEIEIGEYDPTKHGGAIAPPPPAFRSNTPLTALHYHVGLSGIDDADERHELLRSIISCSFKQLPKVGSPDYMRQWGEGKSPQRVRCMAYHLSWNIGFQGAKETNELARHHWLEDLKWLTKNYKAKIPASKWPKVPTS